MIHIVTGKINSGKSTTIQQLFNKQKQGDGFISVKRMHYDIVHGYDIMRLSDRATKRLVVREDYYDHKQEIVCDIGPYLFLKNGIEFVETSIMNMIDQHISPIYLDEIGQLELYDQCFHHIFTILLEQQVDCYITVREQLVQDIIQKYDLKEYEIITVR